MTTDNTIDLIAHAGIVAVVRAPDPTLAVSVAKILVDNGITGIEVTFTTPHAEAAIAECVYLFTGQALVGAGTITTEAQLRLAVEAGAQFLVSPGTEEGLVRDMVSTGLVTMAGALTPTEVMVATRLGAHIIKLFPGSLVGPSYLTALRGPFPDLRFMPTGGVSALNISDWFNAGALAVGAGSDLVPTSALESGDLAAIGAKAQDYVEALLKVRS